MLANRPPAADTAAAAHATVVNLQLHPSTVTRQASTGRRAAAAIFVVLLELTQRDLSLPQRRPPHCDGGSARPAAPGGRLPRPACADLPFFTDLQR